MSAPNSYDSAPKTELNLLQIYEDKSVTSAKVDEDGLAVERAGLQEMLADLAYQNVSHVITSNTSLLWSSNMPIDTSRTETPSP